MHPWVTWRAEQFADRHESAAFLIGLDANAQTNLPFAL